MLADDAKALAIERHGARKSAHATEAGALLAASGEDEHVVAAGYLHDIVEDTDTSVEDVREGFGDRVASIVAALTEDPSIQDYRERKAGLRATIARGGRDAAVVSAADKLSKVRELARTGEDVHPAKADHYAKTLETVTSLAPDHPLTAALHDEWLADRA